jgi:hypothetical protein
VRGGLSLPCAPQEQFTGHAGRRCFCCLAKSNGFVGQSLLERLLMFNAAALCHALLLSSLRKAGALGGDLITDSCPDTRGDDLSVLSI